MTATPDEAVLLVPAGHGFRFDGDHRQSPVRPVLIDLVRTIHLAASTRT